VGNVSTVFQADEPLLLLFARILQYYVVFRGTVWVAVLRFPATVEVFRPVVNEEFVARWIVKLVKSVPPGWDQFSVAV